MKTICKSISVMIAVVICAVSFSSCALLKNEKLDTLTGDMVNALIAKDQEKVIALMHPDYIGTMQNLDSLLDAMANEGIILDGTVNKLTAISRNYVQNDSKLGGKLTESIYNATIGETKYKITINTLANEKGYGIMEFTIKLR